MAYPLQLKVIKRKPAISPAKISRIVRVRKNRTGSGAGYGRSELSRYELRPAVRRRPFGKRQVAQHRTYAQSVGAGSGSTNAVRLIAQPKVDMAAVLNAFAGRRSRQDGAVRHPVHIALGHGVDVTGDTARPGAAKAGERYRQCGGILGIHAEGCKTIA